MKKLKCRDHGGWFMVAPRRGRPPVRCSEDNKCDAQTVATTKPRTANLNTRMVDHASKTRTSDATAVRENALDSVVSANWEINRRATLAEINRVFHELTVQNWTAKRGWINDLTAEITATRGEEMLYIVVKAGMVIQQDYSLWGLEKPSVNGKPKSNLPFDPDEIGDGELARYLVGSKVTWFNRLSGKEETGYCGKDTIKVEHGYNAKGDEMPGERIIKFIDADKLHFTAFRLDQLLKVGK